MRPEEATIVYLTSNVYLILPQVSIFGGFMSTDGQTRIYEHTRTDPRRREAKTNV